MRSIGTCLFALCVLPGVVSAQSPTRPAIYVGPQMRDGFADVDSGIRDSIRDVRQELSAAGFSVTQNETDATLSLTVLARGVVTNGSVGSFVGGLGAIAPNSVPTLTTRLKIGVYERVFQSEGGTWTRAAKTVADDLIAWWDANREAVRNRSAK